MVAPIKHSVSVKGTAVKTHPRRIVLANRPKEAHRRAGIFPQLVYRGGPLLDAVNVVTVYWGLEWDDPLVSQYRSNLDNFFDYIVISPLIDQLAEYSVNGYPIGHGQHSQSVTIRDSDPGSTVTDGDIQLMLQNEIQSGNLPPFDQNTLYFVFLPPGTSVAMGGGASCLTFCGYHDAINGQIFYAVTPFPNCPGCSGLGGNGDLFAALTIVASHELCEVITDPIPGQGWYDDNYGEIGDICEGEGNVKQLNGYTVQLEWSNQQNNCV
jgi:hypothetical protein